MKQTPSEDDIRIKKFWEDLFAEFRYKLQRYRHGKWIDEGFDGDKEWCIKQVNHYSCSTVDENDKEIQGDSYHE